MRQLSSERLIRDQETEGGVGVDGGGEKNIHCQGQIMNETNFLLCDQHSAWSEMKHPT
jgi:hypothetical protein